MTNTTLADNPHDISLLLVEDEEMLRFVLETELTNKGYKVDTASDGREAVEKFLNKPDNYDLILSDVYMSPMNGKTMFQEMKKTDKPAKVIFMTGYTDEKSKGELLQLGASEVLAKPINMDELYAAIEKHLNNGRNTGSA